MNTQCTIEDIIASLTRVADRPQQILIAQSPEVDYQPPTSGGVVDLHQALTSMYDSGYKLAKLLHDDSLNAVVSNVRKDENLKVLMVVLPGCDYEFHKKAMNLLSNECCKHYVNSIFVIRLNVEGSILSNPEKWEPYHVASSIDMVRKSDTVVFWREDTDFWFIKRMYKCVESDVPTDSYWARTDDVQSHLGGNPKCHCGEDLVPVDDHGRFTCFSCDGIGGSRQY